jgi:hypothetical protein
MGNDLEVGIAAQTHEILCDRIADHVECACFELEDTFDYFLDRVDQTVQIGPTTLPVVLVPGKRQVIALRVFDEREPPSTYIFVLACVGSASPRSKTSKATIRQHPPASAGISSFRRSRLASLAPSGSAIRVGSLVAEEQRFRTESGGPLC